MDDECWSVMEFRGEPKIYQSTGKNCVCATKPVNNPGLADIWLDLSGAWVGFPDQLSRLVGEHELKKPEPIFWEENNDQSPER